MAKSKKKKKVATQKRPPRTGKSKVLADLRAFKKRLHSWVDNSKVVWPEGKDWEDGSTYAFVVDDELVNFVYKIMMRKQIIPGQDSDSMEAAIQEKVQAVNEAIKEKGEGLTDEEFREQMGDLLTDEESSDIDGNEEAQEEAEESFDGEAEETETKKEEAEEGKANDRRSAAHLS